MADAAQFSVIVMAGRRSGVVNPIAQRAGVSHKCLAPIRGKPLILHVFTALAETPGVKRVRVCMEPDGWDGVRALAGVLQEKDIPLDFVEARDSLADSAHAAAEGLEGPLLFTTADNVLSTPDAMLRTMQAVFAGSDVSVALARREAVLAARGEKPGPTTKNVGPYRFADGRFSNCNLYGLAGAHVIKAAEMFREGGQFSKNRGRLIRAVGLFNVILLLLRLVSLDAAMRRLSRRFGVSIAAARMLDGSQAVDVDSFRTYDFAEKILIQREVSAA